jgi:hypothetical protein
MKELWRRVKAGFNYAVGTARQYLLFTLVLVRRIRLIITTVPCTITQGSQVEVGAPGSGHRAKKECCHLSQDDDVFCEHQICHVPKDCDFPSDITQASESPFWAMPDASVRTSVLIYVRSSESLNNMWTGIKVSTTLRTYIVRCLLGPRPRLTTCVGANGCDSELSAISTVNQRPALQPEECYSVKVPCDAISWTIIVRYRSGPRQMLLYPQFFVVYSAAYRCSPSYVLDTHATRDRHVVRTNPYEERVYPSSRPFISRCANTTHHLACSALLVIRTFVRGAEGVIDYAAACVPGCGRLPSRPHCRT